MGLSSIKGLNVLAKATGLGAIALVGYDAHKYGKQMSITEEKNFKSDILSGHLYNNMKLDSPSYAKMGLRKKLFSMNTQETISSPFQHIKGYIKGAGEMLITNIIPLTLALGTMCGKVNGTTPIRSGISKFSAIGLIAYGGMFLLREVFGASRNE